MQLKFIDTCTYVSKYWKTLYTGFLYTRNPSHRSMFATFYHYSTYIHYTTLGNHCMHFYAYIILQQFVDDNTKLLRKKL